MIQKVAKYLQIVGSKNLFTVLKKLKECVGFFFFKNLIATNNLLMITMKENMARNTILRLPKELQQVMRLKCKLINKINNNGTKQIK